jgi:hypothetical protein
MRASERAYHFRAIARDVIGKIFEGGLPAESVNSRRRYRLPAGSTRQSSTQQVGW